MNYIVALLLVLAFAGIAAALWYILRNERDITRHFWKVIAALFLETMGINGLVWKNCIANYSVVTLLVHMMQDIQATKECFFELKRRGIL